MWEAGDDDRGTKFIPNERILDIWREDILDVMLPDGEVLPRCIKGFSGKSSQGDNILAYVRLDPSPRAQRWPVVRAAGETVWHIDGSREAWKP